MKKNITLAAIALVCFFVGIALYLNFFPRENTAPPEQVVIKPKTVIGAPRPDFTLLDTADKAHAIKEYDGKVIVLNFWATWCPPCRKEIPALIALQEKYQAQGVQLIGVALDSRQAAVDFVDPMGINYPILVADQEGISLTQAYGNDLGVLPYTVIIDRQGIIRTTLKKELTLEEAEQYVQPLL